MTLPFRLIGSADTATEGMAGGSDARAHLPLFEAYLSGLTIEHVAIAGFDQRGCLVSFVDAPGERCRHGGLTNAVRAAIAPGAVAAIIIAHNHPSGCAEPSRADWEATRHMAALCRLAHVNLIDHLVFGAGTSTSMAAMGWRAPIAACQRPERCL